MTQEQYDKLISENPNTVLVRPFWNNEYYHERLWINKDITILICQRQTKELTQLCMESILRFYPNIQILVVDGNSNDDSILYLRYKQASCKNIKVYERIGRNSHGETMHDAIINHIKTNYVLLMDSDVIVMKHGMIERMLEQFENNPKLYATGNLMFVTKKGEACGVPEDENDILKYAHPCCSMYHVNTYKTLKRFVDHGAACCHNMVDAQEKGLDVTNFPVDNYTIHLSGGSWTDPRTIWSNDNGVFIRPFITFIVTKPEQIEELENLKDHDFNIITKGSYVNQNVVIHGSEPVSVTNQLFDMRFKVNGEYVCLLNESVSNLDIYIMTLIKVTIINNNVPDEINIGGLLFVKRQIWQQKYSLL